MEPVGSQYDQFVVAEWRDHYADRDELAEAFAPLLGGDLASELRQDPYEEGEAEAVEAELREGGTAAQRKREEAVGDDGAGGGGGTGEGAGGGTTSAADRPWTKAERENRRRGRGGRGSRASSLSQQDWSHHGAEAGEEILLLEGGHIPPRSQYQTLRNADEDDFRRALRVFVRNVNKVSAFHVERQAELQQHSGLLQLACNKNLQHSFAANAPDVKHRLKEQSSIRRALVDLYRHLKFLEAYDGLNYTMLMTFALKVSTMLQTYLDSKTHANDDGLQQLILEVEETYASAFCNGSVVHARAALLLKQTRRMDPEQLHFGAYLGICLTLMVWLFWDASIDNGQIKNGSSLTTTAAFPLFRGIFSFLLVLWAWGISCYIWGRYRINYIFMFELDANLILNVQETLSEATKTTVVFFITLLLYFKTVIGTFPAILSPGMYPFLLCVYIVGKFLRPNPFLRHTLHVVGMVVISPLSEVNFFSIFVGDWMTSLVKPEVDLVYGACYLGSGLFLRPESAAEPSARGSECDPMHWNSLLVSSLICALPLWFRFQQCLRRTHDSGERIPNLPNALKYSLAMIVVLLGFFHPFDLHKERSELRVVWIVLFCISGLFSFVWDVRMDWGLGRLEHGLLSDKQMFPRKDLYYLAIIFDFFLRFSWLLTLVSPFTALSVLRMAFPSRESLTVFVQSGIQVMEVIRRMVWGFFRLENEHLRNTLHFRSTSFIPLHFDSVYTDGEKKAARQASGGAGVHALELIALAVLLLACATGIVISRV